MAYTIDAEKCLGCGACRYVCLFNIPKPDALKEKYTISAHACCGCGQCETICPNDAIHVGQFFQMNGGELTIDENTVNDGIQVEKKLDDNDQPIDDADNTGGVIIKGGKLNITVANAQDAKGIKAEGDVDITGGTIVINAKSNGSRGIQTNGDMTISEADNTTNITIAATGGKCTVAEDSEDPHKCWGIKVDGDLTVNAGTLTVSKDGLTTKNGIRCGSYTKKGGTVKATIKEDD